MKACILTFIKDEHEYLDEWIKYHLNLSISHIFIYEDIDSKSHKDITDKYTDVSLANISSVLVPFSLKIAKHLKLTKASNPQEIYAKECLKRIKESGYDWCFLIDNDEYITFEDAGDSLDSILNKFSAYDAFIMRWRCYGANGHIHKPDYSEKGVVDTYTKEAYYVPAAAKSSYSKTCYNMRTYKDEFFWYMHQPSASCNFCNTSFIKDRNTPSYDIIYIRHYITKSWEEYIWKLKSRGFFYGKTRDIDFFFIASPELRPYKDKLMSELKEETLVVLPYKQSGSQGRELFLTLNAWKKYCMFSYHFVVIGEFDLSLQSQYPWCEFIYSKCVPKREGQYNQHIDVQNCMSIIKTKYGHIYDGFIWIADDNYAVKPFTLDDIKTVHYHTSSFTGQKDKPASWWTHDKWKTRQLLDRENLPHVNYTTHYPCWLDFYKLESIWKRYNMNNESYVLEDIYFNYYNHQEPVIDSSIRLGIWNINIYKNEFNKAVSDPNIKFMCNSVDGWSKELEDSLHKIIFE